MLRRRVGVVHQDCRFSGSFAGCRQYCAAHDCFGGANPAQESENLNELLSWVGLADRADALPPELSGGERQRAALARAVIMSPDVILADEPTGNVDWEMSQRLLQLLIELNKMGKTVMIASHDLALIRAAKSQVQGAGATHFEPTSAIGGGGFVSKGSIRNFLLGDPQADRVVPPSGYTAQLTLFVSGAMAFLAVFALALSLASGRLADRWAEELARSATLRINTPADQRAAQTEVATANSAANSRGCACARTDRRRTSRFVVTMVSARICLWGICLCRS